MSCPLPLPTVLMTYLESFVPSGSRYVVVSRMGSSVIMAPSRMTWNPMLSLSRPSMRQPRLTPWSVRTATGARSRFSTWRVRPECARAAGAAGPPGPGSAAANGTPAKAMAAAASVAAAAAGTAFRALPAGNFGEHIEGFAKRTSPLMRRQLSLPHNSLERFIRCGASFSRVILRRCKHRGKRFLPFRFISALQEWSRV
ncbi:hypothetical protein ARTHRO8AJ_60026 [Arthrobacter sp. 8AJ]|nr:hypothetical protein ARTHRO8AJ_60026 [Arthrobacter sp. 8AJ]